MIWLCVACAMMNAGQWIMVRSVRVIGLLICSAWVIQQTHWMIHGGDSLPLFIACDAVIIIWFVSCRRAFDFRERIIAASILPTTVIGVGGYLAGGLSSGWWWLNIGIVAGQMFLGLPWPQSQRLGGAVSHGRLRPTSEA